MHEISLLLVGLLAGSLLTEGLVLVPFWRTLPTGTFYELHGPAGPRLFRYFAPLTAAAVISSIFAAGLERENVSILFAAGLNILALATFFLFFKKVNRNLSRRAYDDSGLALVLRKWMLWHHARTGLVLAGFVALAIS